MNDLQSLAPSSVTVAFPHYDSGTPAGTYTTYTVTLASLALSQYQGVTGSSGTKTIKSSAVASWAGGGSPTNNTELQNLANQIATDYYLWLWAERLDVRYAAVVPWTPEGAHDIEFRQGNHLRGQSDAVEVPLDPEAVMRGWAGRFVTRVMRGPAPDPGGQGQLGHYDSGGSGGLILPTINNSTVTLVGSNLYLINGSFFFSNTSFTIDVSSTLTVNGILIICGYWFICYFTEPQITSNQNNYAPGTTATKLRMSTDATRNLTGIVPPVTVPLGEELVLKLHNVGSNKLVVTHQDASSTAANRFALPLGQNLSLNADDTATFEYDPVTQRWRLDACPALGRPVMRPIVTPSQWTTQQDNYDPGVPFPGVIRPSVGVSSVSLTGIVPPGMPSDHELDLEVENLGSGNLVLKNQSASSTASNRFDFPNSADITLVPLDRVLLRYDPVLSRWTAAAAPPSTASAAPVLTTYNANQIHNTQFQLGAAYANVGGMSIVLAGAGTYQIWASGYFQWNPGAGGNILKARLFDGTNAIGNTDPTQIDEMDATPLGGNRSGSYSLISTYVATGAVTITLQALTTSGGANDFIINSNMFILKVA